MSDGGPTPEDFAAAARAATLQRARGTGPWSRFGCGLGCGLLIVGVGLALAGLRPLGEVGAVTGAALLGLVLGVLLRSADAIARAQDALLPRPEAALAASIAASPDAAGWFVVRVRSLPSGPRSWLAVTLTAEDGGNADARWLPGSAAQSPGGRRVSPLARDRAHALGRRLRTTLGPPPAVSAQVDVTDGAPFDVAACWAGGAPHRVRGNLASTRPPEGDLWAELVEAGLALVDEARAT